MNKDDNKMMGTRKRKKGHVNGQKFCMYTFLV